MGEEFGEEWIHVYVWLGFPGGTVMNNLPVNARDAGDTVSIPGSERSPGVGNGYSSIVAWIIPWTEEPGRLQSMGSQRVEWE